MNGIGIELLREVTFDGVRILTGNNITYVDPAILIRYICEKHPKAFVHSQNR